MGKERNAKGAGSFKLNSDGSVTHRKSVGYKENGNRKILTVTAANKTACIREMKKKESEWNKKQKEGSVGAGTTVAELCRLHLQYQIDQHELKPKSIDRRECTIENHISVYSLGHQQIMSVKVADIENHVTKLIMEKRISVSSIEKVIDVLNAAYTWGIVRGELDFNPVSPIKPTLVKRLQKLKQKKATDADVVVLSHEEETAFVHEAMRRDEISGAFVYPAGLYGLLLLYTGMRCGEMLALRWSDVDLENGYVTIEKNISVAKNRNGSGKKYVSIEGTTKNEKARKLKLLPEAIQVFTLIKECAIDNSEYGFVVTTRTGHMNTATNLEHRMATIFKNAGLTELTGALHIFHRTFATRMYERGVRTKEIAAYIGDLESTTERYYIAVRKKRKTGSTLEQVAELPVTGSSTVLYNDKEIEEDSS